MVIEVKMPALSPTMKMGNIVKWTAKEGDSFEVGDVIAEIETDKAVIEFEALDEGILGKILKPEGSQDVEVGSVIALILEEDESKEDLENYTIEEGCDSSGAQQANEACHSQSGQKAEKDASCVSDSNAKTTDNGLSRKCITPLARNIAATNNISLSGVEGSGPRGRIVKKDVENVISSNSRNALDDNVAMESIEDIESVSFENKQKVVPMSNMRKVISRRLSESKSTIPHFYINMDIKMTELIKLRQKLNEDKCLNSLAKVTINDIIIKAVSTAMQVCPSLNCYLQGENIIYNSRSDISVAISTKDGLYVPVIEGADRMTLSEISKKVKYYAHQAKSKALTPKELSGGTIAISNLGMFGVKNFSAIVNPPQASILSIGGVQSIVNLDSQGKPFEEQVINIGISADHRIIDGMDAAKFLKTLKHILENPLAIIL